MDAAAAPRADFVCSSDGTNLPAHKAVLAAASDYFACMFGGPWAATHPDGTWPTANPPELMRAVLTFAYTGVLDETLLDSHATELLGVAHERGRVSSSRTGRMPRLHTP